ncbi:MAG TPA: ATP-binding protein [Puia sp.]|jgi:signal transduction histidine kinase|nr:ATP-binding protein [Puia sp.]
MKFDFPKKIRSGYLAAFILLLLCYFLSLSSFIQLRKQNKWVGHTREVINKLAILNSNLKDAEISWSEYLLKKQKTYLLDYKESRTLVDSVFQVLSKSVSDNPEEKSRLESMHDIIVKRYNILDEELGILNKNNFQINDSIRTREQQNNKLIDSIEQFSDSITVNENRLLNLRTQRVIFYSKIVFWIIIGAGLVSGLLIIYSLVTFNMESQAKKKATIQAESYHDQLEKRVKELASANQELLELRSLERFTSMGRVARVIAHEIRNPLTNIDLSANHLESDNLDGEDKKLFLDIIARNSRRINELINELLSATKFTDLQYEEIRVDVLLDESLNEAFDRAQLNRVRIEKKYSNERIWLNVDRSRMKIAILNIIVNAMEAITGENGCLTIETTYSGENCIIIIRDNGKGMDEETMAKVFDPYFTSKTNGNGLGMTNSQNIILNHKGKIEVISEEGNGTSFIITLNCLRKEAVQSV